MNGKEYHIEGAASHTRIRLRICCIELHPRPQSIVLGKHTSQMWTNGLLSVFVNGADGLYSWPMAQKLYGGEYGCQLQLKIGQQNVLLTSRNLGDEQWWNDAIHFTVNQPQIELLQVRVWIETKRNSHGNTTAGMYQFLESEVPELVTDSKDNASKASGKESNERARKTLLLASGKLPVRSLLTHSSPDDQPMLQPIELPLHGRLHQCRLYMLCVYQSVRYKDDLIKAYEESGASAFRFAELEHFTEVDEKHI